MFDIYYYAVIYNGFGFVFNNKYSLHNFIKSKNKNVNYPIKRFNSRKQARKWIKKYMGNIISVQKKCYKDSVYVSIINSNEIRITDYSGNSLSHYIKSDKLKINESGNFYFKNKTKFYMKMAGLFLSMKIVMNNNCYNKVVCDTLTFLSEFENKVNNVLSQAQDDRDLIRLVNATLKLKSEFQKHKGNIIYMKKDLIPSNNKKVLTNM